MSAYGFARPSHEPGNTTRIMDHEQAGWNAGYLAGEGERVALATANGELRTQIHELRERLHGAYQAIVKHGIVCDE